MQSWALTFVLGSGLSASSVDFARLREAGWLLGVNLAGLSTPCDAIFSLDRPFMLEHRQRLAAVAAEVHVCLPRGQQESCAPPGARIWWRVGDCPPSERPDTISHGLGGGGNSGLSAINLAAQRGAQRIVLIGFDMDPENRCWCGPNPGPRPTRARVLESFAYCAPWYAQRGIEVLNANPDSAIEGFQKVAPESIL